MNEQASTTLYEHIFKAKNQLYVRTYNTITKESTLKTVKYTPPIFIKDNSKDTHNVEYKSILSKEPLKKVLFKNSQEYKDAVNIYKSSGVPMYGNSNEVQSYIRDNWPKPLDSDHDFHNWYIDIETMVDITDPNHDKRKDWKPYGTERSATAIITSIQIYDTKAKEFYILGLKKEWANDNNYESPHGKINYWNLSTEENLLKVFISLLKKRNPTMLTGFNSAGYDYPYLTNRIIRIMDKREDLYIKNKKDEYIFNRDTLNGSWVKELSPVGLIKHREVETNYGKQDEFEWVGIFLEDYKDLHEKYTYTVLTSKSLQAIAEHELGKGKVEHSEFTDFGDFYENSFNLFIEYGIKDVELLIELENKLKLIDLAKMVSYTTGVNLSDVRGTLKQWNSFMFNESLNNGYVLPLENRFDKIDTSIFDQYKKFDIGKERTEFFNHLETHVNELGEHPLKGQRFAGGITRGTGDLYKWIYYLDFASLYPSVIQWANIGLDTLILPKDLPEELQEIRAKYCVYYSKETAPKDLIKYDFEFAKNAVFNEENKVLINKVLKKYNVSMTPNGMFFSNEKQSIMSSLAEYLMTQRKTYKKEMKAYLKEIKDNNDKLKTLDPITDKDTIIELKDKTAVLTSKADKANVYQMGLKILNNSMYGSLSMQANTFAGHSEYFSTAITSGARLANLTVSQSQTWLINKFLNRESKETKYGVLTHLDKVVQIDTDSVTYDTEIYVNGKREKIGEFFDRSNKDFNGEFIKRSNEDYVKKIEDTVYALSFNTETQKVQNKKIKYVMAHKVNKRLYNIKYLGNSVVVTEDHSVVVKRGKTYVDVKPKSIKSTDKLIGIDGNKTTINSNFEVEDLGVQSQWVYDIEVEDNHNFFGNDILVHNSTIVHIGELLEKKFGKDFEDKMSSREIAEFVLKFVDKVAIPDIRDNLDNNLSFLCNSYNPGVLDEDTEVVADRFISIVPKMYYCRKIFDEGLFYNKEDNKLKITGLSTVRSSTPKYYRGELKNAMNILIDGDLQKTIRYISEIKEKTYEQQPSQICINQGVSSLDYDYDENLKKYRKWKPDKNKFLSAPVNSRASIVHNKYVSENKLEIKEIEAGDKISFLYMKEPNIVNSNAFAFRDNKVFDQGLKDYIDYNTMFEKGFMKPIKLITDPLKWDLTPEDELINEDEW